MSTYIISGTFDPLHAGHLDIAHYLETIEKHPNIVFEIGRAHCDKSGISMSIEDRAAQFKRINRKVQILNGGSFLEKKIELSLLQQPYRGDVWFCMGEDTFSRFIDPESYFGSVKERDIVIDKFFAKWDKYITPSILLFPRGEATSMTVIDGYWMPHESVQKFIKGHKMPVATPNAMYIPNPLSSTAIRNKNATNPAKAS